MMNDIGRNGDVQHIIHVHIRQIMHVHILGFIMYELWHDVGNTGLRPYELWHDVGNMELQLNHSTY